jgi:hypothetical protein
MQISDRAMSRARDPIDRRSEIVRGFDFRFVLLQLAGRQGL